VQIKITPNCLEAASGATEFQHSSLGGTALYKEKTGTVCGIFNKISHQ